MKIRMMALSISMGAALAAGTVSAQQPSTPANEYQRQMNVPKAVAGTHKSRAAERAAKRKELKALNHSHGLPQAGDDWGMHPRPQAAAHESAQDRRAERVARQQELKRLNKAGQLPVSDEADVARMPGARP